MANALLQEPVPRFLIFFRSDAGGIPKDLEFLEFIGEAHGVTTCLSLRRGRVHHGSHRRFRSVGGMSLSNKKRAGAKVFPEKLCRRAGFRRGSGLQTFLLLCAASLWTIPAGAKAALQNLSTDRGRVNRNLRMPGASVAAYPNVSIPVCPASCAKPMQCSEASLCGQTASATDRSLRCSTPRPKGGRRPVAS